MAVVQLEDGRTFEIRFGHSLHDIKQFDTLTAPGSMFQVLNNLARSMRRRFTVCSIAEMGPDWHTMLAQGFTMCKKGEQYTRNDGRCFSLVRALRCANLPRPVRKQIVEKLGYDWDTLRQNYR